jgi:hypothetical protein
MKEVMLQKVTLKDFLMTENSKNLKQIQTFTNERTALMEPLDQLNMQTACIVMKNKIQKYCCIVPLSIMNKSSLNYQIPKHWNISANHKLDLVNLLQSEYDIWTKYKDSDVEQISSLFFNQYVKYRPILDKLRVQKINVEHMCIDADIEFQILKYIFVKMISTVVESMSDNSEVAVMKTLLKAYKLDMKNYIKLFNFDMEYIRKKVLKSKEREKDRITRELKKKSDQEREVSNVLKQNKLGEWNIGEQRGLRMYDKNFRDLHRPEGDEYYNREDMEHELVVEEDV